jgi:hypothetical protein
MNRPLVNPRRADPPARIKGRGAASNPEGRFETSARETVDDGWEREAEPPPHPDTTVTEERARSIISRNESPDIPFGTCMRGEGAFAELIKQRFAVAARRHVLARGRDVALDLSLFRPPRAVSPQGELF